MPIILIYSGLLGCPSVSRRRPHRKKGLLRNHNAEVPGRKAWRGKWQNLYTCVKSVTISAKKKRTWKTRRKVLFVVTIAIPGFILHVQVLQKLNWNRITGTAALVRMHVIKMVLLPDLPIARRWMYFWFGDTLIYI